VMVLVSISVFCVLLHGNGVGAIKLSLAFCVLELLAMGQSISVSLGRKVCLSVVLAVLLFQCSIPLAPDSSRESVTFGLGL